MRPKNLKKYSIRKFVDGEGEKRIVKYLLTEILRRDLHVPY